MSTLFVFLLGVIISYFLCDFYNDINDNNRINFSKQESQTLEVSIGDALLIRDTRGFTYASALNTFPTMSTDLKAFRDLGALPTVPALSLTDPPPSRVVGQPGIEAYQFVRRVLHSEREEFEKDISKQYNQSIQITDYNTLEVLPEKPEYWCVYLHALNARVLGRDITTDPDRNEAFEFLKETGKVSYTSPVPSALNGKISHSKFFEIVTTPQGTMGLVGVFTIVELKIDESTNTLQFLTGGNGGRRLTLHQVQNGVSSIVYDAGNADDLIFESKLEINEKTHFIMSVYDNKNFDNSQESLVFMVIGIAVSLVLAIWEYFRSGASNKAREHSESKSKFLANISHEIRTPINGIVGISDVLSKENLPPTPTTYVDIIVSCSTSLISILNNVLDMSKIDAGKMENNKKNFVMRRLVLSTLRDSWGVVHAKNPNLDKIYVIITENVPYTEIFGNETHIFQILNNLVSNASKFTDKGYIEVKIDATQLKNNEMDIHMYVRDTGCGMSEEAIGKLFKPFSQVHNGNKSVKGTGLGLSISMKLAKAMGGDIKCKSKLGEGTTFIATFKIPGQIRSDNSQQEIVVFDAKHNIDDEFIGIIKPVKAVDVVLKEDTIFLVVDDNKTNQMVMKRMLESIGASNIDLANDGQDSINMTMTKKYDMILMDKFMPIVDGIDATRTIRTNSVNKSNKSPIIFLSADTEDESISKCIKAGANEFMGKPYRLDSLIDVIYKVEPSILITHSIQ